MSQSVHTKKAGEAGSWTVFTLHKYLCTCSNWQLLLTNPNALTSDKISALPLVLSGPLRVFCSHTSFNVTFPEQLQRLLPTRVRKL